MVMMKKIIDFSTFHFYQIRQRYIITVRVQYYITITFCFLKSNASQNIGCKTTIRPAEVV